MISRPVLRGSVTSSSGLDKVHGLVRRPARSLAGMSQRKVQSGNEPGVTQTDMDPLGHATTQVNADVESLRRAPHASRRLLLKFVANEVMAHLTIPFLATASGVSGGVFGVISRRFALALTRAALGILHAVLLIGILVCGAPISCRERAHRQRERASAAWGHWA